MNEKCPNYESQIFGYTFQEGANLVISREIRLLAALYLPSYKKNALKGCDLELPSRSPLSVFAGGVMLMQTAFEPNSIVLEKKIHMGGGITLLGV